MPYDLEKLKEEYTNYQKKNLISRSQLKLIRDIYNHYIEENEITTELNTIISEILGFKVDKLEILTYQDCVKICWTFNKKLLKITKSQKNAIGDKISCQILSEILNKEIKNLDDLNRSDFFKILNNEKYNFNYCLKNFNLKREDKVIISKPSYEYGYQVSKLCRDNRMYYLKFYNLMLLDYDDLDLETIKKNIANFFGDSKKYCFYIYKTSRGFHLYYMSDAISYLNIATCYLMKHLGCDPWYILFSHKNGFKIRLSPKKDRDEIRSESFIGKYGDGPINKECQELINILDSYHITRPISND